MNIKFLENSVYEYAFAIGIIIAAIIIIQIIKRKVISKTKESGDEALIHQELFIKAVNRLLIPFLYLGSLYIAIQTLSFGEKADSYIEIGYEIIAAWYGIRFMVAFVNFSISKYVEKTRNEEDSKRIKPLFAFLNFVIWIIGLLFLLDNLGFQVSTIIAGLGISGIAVALAAQAILGDLFSYFVIFFDKPFEIGDFIVFDDKKGTVEKIGIKSTKIRSLSGEVIVVSNSNLTNSRLHNYKQLNRRRVVFTIGVTYQTKAEQLKYIPQKIKEVITEIELTEFDRSHFSTYGDFSINFETVYFILSDDYKVYMDIQQEINLKLFEDFNEKGIEFAYPTQTLYLNKEN
ncbi:MAG: mechanosensitive ion channel family protein [Melioribacteraceae bacterium]|nr:MAG: mechanosensitive ion channel family protein [Melioribacteraceae bacterium]